MHLWQRRPAAQVTIRWKCCMRNDDWGQESANCSLWAKSSQCQRAKDELKDKTHKQQRHSLSVVTERKAFTLPLLTVCWLLVKLPRSRTRETWVWALVRPPHFNVKQTGLLVSKVRTILLFRLAVGTEADWVCRVLLTESGKCLKHKGHLSLRFLVDKVSWHLQSRRPP